MRAGLAIGVALTATVALSSCASNESGGTASGSTGASPSSSSSSGGGAAPSGTLNGVGSSAQGSAQDAWRKAFQQTNSGATVNYDPSGSGAGRTAFINGGAQFAGSDSALKPEELASTFKLCKSGTKAIDIPVYISPIAVAYNVPGLTSLNLDPTTVAKIFSGTITKWNDPAIAALNKGAKLPSAAIGTVHRSDKSGTTANFTDYLSKTAPKAWTKPAADVWPFSSGDGAQGTSGVVSAIKGGKNTIGYADESKAKGLGIAKIKIGSQFVAPSADGAAKLVESSPLVTGRAQGDLAVALNRTVTDPSEYPITLVSYDIACQTYGQPNVGSLVKSYLTYVTSAAGQSAAASAAGSAPLTSALVTKAKSAVDSIK